MVHFHTSRKKLRYSGMADSGILLKQELSTYEEGLLGTLDLLFTGQLFCRYGSGRQEGRPLGHSFGFDLQVTSVVNFDFLLVHALWREEVVMELASEKDGKK
ncbi:hypothetical protein CEXT_716671 [Caerostris extrusa]|uniref:Uncharacterized protein n=1 Tax=Caerostris extrusa TaxID=172846 RepID=A0AAV4RHK3_CAEEX|nr:hypothetical protein CEXT_716671 [Caerostris extrusa]